MTDKAQGVCPYCGKPLGGGSRYIMVTQPNKPGIPKSILVCHECDAKWVELNEAKLKERGRF